MRMFSHCGQVWPPPQRQTFLHFYFQELSSRICAIDCLGSEIIELHSLQTPTRMLEYVIDDRFMRMSRAS